MITTEMNKLIHLLADYGVPFEVQPMTVCEEATFAIVCRSVDGSKVVDAVSHETLSLGGREGLIEVLGSLNPDYPNDDVIGYLTADQAYKFFLSEPEKPCWPFIPFF